MTGCRHLVRHRWIAALAIIVATLLTRMMIPTGYMPMVENGHLVMTLCAEQNPGMAEMAAMPPMPMAAMSGDATHSGDHDKTDHDKNASCGFGGLSLSSLAAIDPILLALALLFIVADGFRHWRRVRIAARHFLWPPRTGPPANA